MGVFLVPFAQVGSTKRLLFLSEALIVDTNFEPSISKLRVLWRMGCFGAEMGPLGAAHGDVFGPVRLRGLDHAVPLPFRGLDTKFEPSISKTLGFMA